MQRAVLDPGTRYQDYLSTDPRNTSATKRNHDFPNIVRLDVSGGDGPNSSCINLPGVIANTPCANDKHLIKRVKNLVEQRTGAERSVNMLTLPMTPDVENSQVCAMVQNLKAEQYTRAVFTKADLADTDQRDQVLRKLMGNDDLGVQRKDRFVVVPANVAHDKARRHGNDFLTHDSWSLWNQDLKSRLRIDACTRRSS